MNTQTLQLLNIDDSLKNELAILLVKFEGLRVGKDLSMQNIKEETDSVKKQSTVSRLVKRFFLTEYAA